MGWHPQLGVATIRALLTVDPEQADRELRQVRSSRARLVDAFDSKRARIERDLHDGAQQQLVQLTMRLGLARTALPQEHPAYDDVAAAHDQAKVLMEELRRLVRGIHPTTLTDRGLPAALEELAAAQSIPVELDLRIPPDLPRAVQSSVYFAVAEALTTVAKHAGAARVAIVGQVAAERVLVTITDDAHGGARPGPGTGLSGIADRLAAIDGTLAISSPAGGPTVVALDVPGSPV